MAKHKYRIASEEGAARYQQEVGEEVDLDLDRDEQRAVVAAGWVEQTDLEDDEPKQQQKKKEG